MAYIKLHAENIRSNLSVLAKKAGGNEKIIAVLKDNAYGHGLELFAKKISKFGITHAITRDLEEALRIEEIFQDVIVLSEHEKSFVKHPKIIFAANALESLANAPQNIQIALKIDTGMHRNGINIDELETACKIATDRKLSIHSVFTHFRSADEMGCDLFFQQQNFENVKTKFRELSKKYSLPKVFFHSHNSAALLRSNSFDEDFARIGIAMYGYCDLPKTFGDFGLKGVLELFAKKISSRNLKKGERVGYGGMFEANSDMVSSTYDVGYADGLFRFDGKSELKTTDGFLILGRTSMDSISVNSDKNELSILNNAEIWAKHFNTISYDILVKLNPKIPREFI